MISGANEEELIVANARAEVLTKCGKDILDILDNQNEKYEKQLEHEVKYQNNEVVRLNNIINGMEKFFKNSFDNEVRPLGSYKVSVWTICLDKLKELKEGK